MQYEPQVLERLRKEEINILSRFIDICEKYDIPYFAAFGTAIGAVRHGGYIPWDDDLDIGMLRADYDRFLTVWQEMGENFELINPLTTPTYACSVTHIQKKGTLFLSEDDKDCRFKKGINMDIFVFDNMPEDEGKRRRQLRKTYILGRLIFLCDNTNVHLGEKGLKLALFKFTIKSARLTLKLFRVTSQKLYKKLEKEAMRYNGQESQYIASFCCPMAEKESFRRDWLFPLKETAFENITVKIPHREDLILTKQYGDYMLLPPPEQRVSHRPAVVEFDEEMVVSG